MPPDCTCCYFNPRTPRGVRLVPVSPFSPCGPISIHAPLAGCDQSSVLTTSPSANFNPRTPRGVRRHAKPNSILISTISIHAPLAGCDGAKPRVISTACSFQSTHPSRGATGMLVGLSVLGGISIHAPLAGCDHIRHPASPRSGYFNPRTPRGVRLVEAFLDRARKDFNPRTPRGVRQKHPDILAKCCLISIHAPLAGCDVPDGGDDPKGVISIHAPLAGCDGLYRPLAPSGCNFNPRTPRGVRLSTISQIVFSPNFNPRTPRGVRP